jgi:hypothetical protein
LFTLTFAVSTPGRTSSRSAAGGANATDRLWNAEKSGVQTAALGVGNDVSPSPAGRAISPLL